MLKTAGWYGRKIASPVRVTSCLLKQVNLVLTSAIKIEVNRPVGTPIGQIMNEIRSWLDENRIEPVDFRTLVGREGIGFEIRFRTEQEGERFQRAFG